MCKWTCVQTMHEQQRMLDHHQRSPAAPCWLAGVDKALEQMYGTSDPADYVAMHLRMGNLLHEDGAMERDGDRVQVGACCCCCTGTRSCCCPSGSACCTVREHWGCSWLWCKLMYALV
jgi:hypothetical protein